MRWLAQGWVNMFGQHEGEESCGKHLRFANRDETRERFDGWCPPSKTAKIRAGAFGRLTGNQNQKGESLLSLLQSADGAWVSRSEQFASRRSGYSLSI